MKKRIKRLLEKKIVVLDGAIGTELYQRGMPGDVCPETWCLENPRIVSQIHLEYKDSGADIIYTPTFGANRIKLSQYGIKNAFKVSKNLALLVRQALGRKALIAGDIGPTGKFVKPFGVLDFEEAVDIFKEQAKGLLSGGVDLFVIETMMDIQEARAALIAVRELSDVFTIVTMTYEESGRTLNGNDLLGSLITLQSLGADAFGCNCSTGPCEMAKFISELKSYAMIPLVAKPNAGMPKLIGNRTSFGMGVNEFSLHIRKIASSGANMIGGCCGTTPAHIAQLKKTLVSFNPIPPSNQAISALSSPRQGVVLKQKKNFFVVGEKINPTGKKRLQIELSRGKLSLLRQLAKEQQDQGADLLDVNVGIAGINEKKLMQETICALTVITGLPLVVDSAKPEVVEAAVRLYPGRTLINSISGEKNKLKKLLPIAKKYGAMFVLLPLAGKELPKTFLARKKIIKLIFKKARKIGLNKSDFLVDGLVMPLSWSNRSAQEVLKVIRWCSDSFGANTIMGLSNISFGMPKRHIINRAFLTLAKKNGLTLAIADPLDNRPIRNKLAENLLLGKDKGGIKFVTKYLKEKERRMGVRKDRLSPQEKVYKSILDGNKEDIRGVINEALTLGFKPLRLMQKVMIPAVIKVGEFFEKKKYFLPQLIASAETMKKGTQYLESFLKKDITKMQKKAIILMATVQGDVHDIGKNIVSLMLENHGFQIIDLGKDVSTERIIQEIKRHSPDIVGLSALMTTTMVEMEDIISAAKREGLKCDFLVGGAVLNKSYARSIGAEYAKDGVEAVRVAEKLYKKK